MSEETPPYSKQLRMKNAETLRCPMCGASNTIRYPKRWNCHSCHTKWTSFKLWYYIWFSKNGKFSFFSSLLLPLAAVLSVLYFLITLFQGNPIDIVKTSVRHHYDVKYGSESRKKLRQDWGWWYREEGDARNDYTQHNPNR